LTGDSLLYNTPVRSRYQVPADS